MGKFRDRVTVVVCGSMWLCKAMCQGVWGSFMTMCLWLCVVVSLYDVVGGRVWLNL